MRRFPPETPKPQEVIDLEKPDEEDVTLKWNEMMDQSNAATNMEKATAQLQEWKEKLDAFNIKVPKPEAEVPVEIIQQDNSVTHIDLKSQKKTDEEETLVDKELQQMKFERYDRENEKKIAETVKKARKDDGFDIDEHKYDMDPVINLKWDQDEEIVKIIEQHEEPTISEQIEEVMEPERTRPDFTEVIDTEQAVQEMMENPKKAIQEDLKIVNETARKTVEADMSKLAIEPEIGEFTGGYKPMFVKKSQEKINKDAYVQNEEQTDTTSWKKIKTKLTSETQYHEMQEKRIDDLMSKVDSGEIKIEDLTPEDRQVIIDIRMQNESGDNINKPETKV
tara:strand:- start:1104 stop:2111 length:1008 start_codon:yes stop_codon:yes gene_type:complete